MWFNLFAVLINHWLYLFAAISLIKSLFPLGNYHVSSNIGVLKYFKCTHLKGKVNVHNESAFQLAILVIDIMETLNHQYFFLVESISIWNWKQSKEKNTFDLQLFFYISVIFWGLWLHSCSQGKAFLSNKIFTEVLRTVLLT